MQIMKKCRSFIESGMKIFNSTIETFIVLDDKD